MATHQEKIHQTQLPPTVDAPSMARGMVRAAGRGLSPRVLDDAQLLVSELVSDVLAYAREPHPIHLRIRTNHVLSLEVEEASQTLESASAHRDPTRRTHPSAWSRDLVATLADAWGVSARDGRSSAWAELRLDR